MIGHLLTLRDITRGSRDKPPDPSMIKSTAVTSSSSIPTTSGVTHEKYMLHDNDESLTGTEVLSDATAKLTDYRKSAEVIRSEMKRDGIPCGTLLTSRCSHRLDQRCRDTVQRTDNDSTFKITCQIESSAEVCEITSSSSMPTTSGVTHEKCMLHDNDESLTGTEVLSDATAKSTNHQKSAEVIRFPRSEMKHDGIPCGSLLTSRCSHRLDQCSRETVQRTDNASTVKITYQGGHSCLRCLDCSCVEPTPSLLQVPNQQSMKIAKILKRAYTIVMAIRLMLYFKMLKDELKLPSSKKMLKDKLLDRLACFCSLLPPNFVFDKAKMIQLWVAQGFFDSEWGPQREVVANEHFDKMLSKNLIVQSGFDDLRRTNYRVGNAVSSRSHLRVKASELISTPREIQHLSLLSEKLDRATCEALKRFNQLRTLMVFCPRDNSVKEVPDNLFQRLQHLRILDLQATKIKRLPRSINYLPSLHFLDLSRTPIKELPETLGCLRRLQTLRLVNCTKLRELPRSTSKLISLRHLEFDIFGQLSIMPARMGNLTNLQTLEGFIVRDGEGYGARELKHLTNLCGSFFLTKLEHISSVEDAREAALNKKRFDKLWLRWDHLVDDTPLLEEIMEHLQPHSGLKELKISYYNGSRLPAWMSTLSNIVSIRLFYCFSCSCLPSLGGLPSLKSLEFLHLDGVRYIHHEFCRHGRSQTGSAFPKLENLRIDGMQNLEKWIGVKNGDFPCLLQLSVVGCPKLTTLPMLSVFSSLTTLKIFGCDQLPSLPKGKLPWKLEHLSIAKCPLVKERCRKAQGEDWSRIKHIPSIFIDFEQVYSS